LEGVSTDRAWSAWKCSSLAVWDGRCRSKAAHLMKQDGAALMSRGDGGGKSKEGRKLEKKARFLEKKLGG